MCGIAGIAGNIDDPLIHTMTSLLHHRGPDGSGHFHARGIALGHRRLAILDLTSAGAQPMRSRDGRFSIVFNGEIFNYPEIRSELRGSFISSGDAEVLLEACTAWGVERTLPRLNGMFAFALWDEMEETLTLARDRSGEKPLVYFWDGKTFAFASEIKALSGFHSSSLDPAAVEAYLALGYVPAPLAVFRDCRKVPAGHFLRYHAGQIELRRWWFPEQARSRTLGPADAEAELRELAADAVRLRLRADVPVAVCLSGGVDSSAVAAECAGNAPVEAFTVALDGDETDLPFARLTARQLGLRHCVIRCGAKTISRQLEEAVTRFDEPFADSSALPALALAQSLAPSHKVVLTGDGGDEVFGGYPHYEYVAAKQAIKRAAAAAGWYDGSGRSGVYVQSKALFRRHERACLLGSHAPDRTFSDFLEADAFLPHASGSSLRRALWHDRHLHLPNDLTFKMDIALAAFGMEARAPFLDHRILEWAQDLDARDLVRGGQKKVLLRRAYRGRLPDAVLDRPKHGFGSPIGAWLSGPLKQTLADYLPCPLLDAAPQLRARGQRLWILLTFALWARRWGAEW